MTVLLLRLFVLSAALPGVAKSGADVNAFVPKGWAIEQRVNGDLDGDAIPDAVLVLLENDKGDDSDPNSRQRALVVLRGAKKGFELLGTNVGLAACYQCLGVKGGDATPEVTIQKRVIIVNQFGGSRDYYGATHRFRLEKNGVRLIGVDHSGGDAIMGSSETKSENLLTGAVVVETQPAQRDESGEEIKTPTEATAKHSKVAVKPLPALEDVQEYGGNGN